MAIWRKTFQIYGVAPPDLLPDDAYVEVMGQSAIQVKNGSEGALAYELGNKNRPTNFCLLLVRYLGRISASKNVSQFVGHYLNY